MIKRAIYAVVVLAGMLAIGASCQRDDLYGTDRPDDGYVKIRFGADIPSMPVIQTRAVDPDGGGVQNMTLFCFDSYGLFTATAKAELTPDSDLNGTFEAKVPKNTRLIHFLGNQNMLDFKESSFYNQSEAQVMAALEGSSGMMVYWGRFACATGDDSPIDVQLKAQGSIELIRNHALISVENPETNGFLVVTGFVVCNTSAFGTVAPFHPTEGFVWPGSKPFVTLPRNTAVMSDILDVTSDTRQYVFECENTADKPVSVILRGYLPEDEDHTPLYYRVMLIDGNGEQLLIRRNHHYKLNIKGKLSYDQPTFGEALEAAATNNVWISIQDNINEVSDNTYTLKVEQTSYVLGQQFEGNPYEFQYEFKRNDGDPLNEEEKECPDVTWLDGNNVGGQVITHTFNYGAGEGKILVNLNKLGINQKLEGTLLVKKGLLQRKIKVILIQTQTFQPTWVASQVHGTPSTSDANEEYGEHVTLMFTVPETCPAELFPLRVLIGVEDLDVRAAAGMSLPVVRRGEDDFGQSITNEENGKEIEYKFVYTAQQPGVQRAYFRTILPQTGTNVRTLVSIEAEHFEPETKYVTYTEQQYMIEVFGLSPYNAAPDDEFADDETIYYRLVPQKRNAYVEFNMHLHNNATEKENDDYGEFVAAQPEDEFLIYSQHLDHIPDGQEPEGIVFDCEFWPVDELNWTSSGRVHMFKPEDPENPASGKGPGNYKIYMRTNTPKSAEVVRIASNTTGENLHPENPGPYRGRGYRSTTFELANYNPFRFAAQINDVGDTSVTGDAEEPETELMWKYENPTLSKVDIAFDVTSFRGTDNKSADPFGEEFEIYIDAPMLTIDEGRLGDYNLTADKLKADPEVEGRFIYTVDASREAERSFGAADALREDKKLSGTNVPEGDPEPDQSSERKVLPFKLNQVVSAGDITLSSNEEKVVFFRKTFRITNESVRGTMRYSTGSGEQPSFVPNSTSVSFSNQRTGSRIGSMTVKANGQYELRLRKEYTPGWLDPVELHCTVDGVVYHESESLTLGDFVSKSEITLIPAE